MCDSDSEEMSECMYHRACKWELWSSGKDEDGTAVLYRPPSVEVVDRMTQRSGKMRV
jgi:hypothetical protein